MPPLDQQKIRKPARRSASAVRPSAVDLEEGEGELSGMSGSLIDRFFHIFNGDEGAAFAISFVVHIVLLMLLAIPIVKSFEDDPGFTTLVENSTEEEVIYDAPLDTLLAQPEEASAEATSKVDILDSRSPYMAAVPEFRVADQNAVKSDGDGSGNGNDGDLGGGRIAEPDSAIKAGSFSVWPWPILPGKIGGAIRHGTPGSSPKVRQSYSIVIRLKVPKEKKFVRTSDFSGSVVGTDGYTQKIPDNAFFFTPSGELVKARTGLRMPVIDGTAEILVEVPGASIPNVKDTIRVYSRILDEEQEIELVFQARESE